MSISGLVITLSDDRERAEHALRRLGSDERLELGRRDGRRVAAVADTPSADADRGLWDVLHATPGVAHVDVVYVGLDPDTEEEPSR